MATRNQSAIDWRIVALIGGILAFLLVIGAINTLAESTQSLLLEAGISQGVAGDVGAIVFTGVFLGLVALVIKTIGKLSRV